MIEKILPIVIITFSRWFQSFVGNGSRRNRPQDHQMDTTLTLLVSFRCLYIDQWIDRSILLLLDE